MKDTKERLSFTTRALHGLVALGMIGLLILGFVITNYELYQYMSLHKSLGIIVFVIATCRVLWRIVNGWPASLSPKHNPLQELCAKVVHWVLILTTILFPLSGMVMSAAGGRGLQVFGLEIFASNFVDGKPVALDGSLAGLAHQIHVTLPAILIIALVLHVVGAIYHHVVLKDRTLLRMLGR